MTLQKALDFTQLRHRSAQSSFVLTSNAMLLAVQRMELPHPRRPTASDATIFRKGLPADPEDDLTAPSWVSVYDEVSPLTNKQTIRVNIHSTN
jgi:hypothetical protein